MNSLSEVRRVRSAMSEAVGHDIRALIAKINESRPQCSSRIIDPGTAAEQCDAAGQRATVVRDGTLAPVAR